MSIIRYLCLPLLGALGVAWLASASAAEQSLGEAVRAADAKYLEAPEIGTVDKSPKIVAGGGEDGLPALDDEISSGPLRVTLTYVEEEPQPEEKPKHNDLPGEADDAAVESPAVDEHWRGARFLWRTFPRRRCFRASSILARRHGAGQW
ncbi:hypothetical protein [Methyloceanibacter marginalis]|uniref:hypothetical protein n=1 Tax=Methyloceanibacter marginalis TaxID=1774971 RepID=UPI00114D2586|nr:hypothetical protein [Methyloceanibacter marginalis]